MTPAITRLLAKPGVEALTADTLDAFTAHGPTGIFFTGNATRYPEIDDLATILPELMAAFPQKFRLGVIDPDTARPLAVKYRITIRPTLVFLRNGVILGTLPRMRDWAVYLDEISKLLAPTAAEVS